MRLKNTLLLPVLILMLFVVSCNQSTDDSNAGANKNLATNFILDSLTENKQHSLEEFQGKGVVLNFWATWCTPCREEMPLFEEVWNKYKDKNVVFVGVDVMDDRNNAKEFLESIGISYPNLYDPEGTVSRKYNVIALPATFFIDKDGIIVGKNYGPFLGDEGKKILKSYVEEISQ